jgi:hypothetical protein
MTVLSCALADAAAEALAQGRDPAAEVAKLAALMARMG